MAPTWHQNGAKRAPQTSKVEPEVDKNRQKVTRGDQNGALSEPTGTEHVAFLRAALTSRPA